MEALLTILGGIVGIGLLMLYSAFSWGFVFYKYYYWFILPVFTTMPHIAFVQAVGLMMFVGLFKTIDGTEMHIDGKKVEKKPAYVLAVILPWLVLGIAYFIKSFL